MLQLFPEKYNNELDLAKSKLVTVSSDSPLDSIVFLDRLPVHFKSRSGYVYFFKCKHKKEDNSWKLASVGIFPFDLKKLNASIKNNSAGDDDYDFTDKPDTRLNNSEPIKVQLEKALKKLEYSRRKSASMFYNDDGFANFDFQKMVDIKE